MSTTTIRLPEELKERVNRVAQRAGTTAHAFILDAIAEGVEDAERRDEFHATAEQRYAQIVASGKTLPWQAMRAYLEERIAGSQPPRPKARKLAR
jgi:predicted transcriptional regulator